MGSRSLHFFSSNIDGTLDASQATHEKSHPTSSWLSTLKLVVAIGIAYFVAAQFGLASSRQAGRSGRLLAGRGHRDRRVDRAWTECASAGGCCRGRRNDCIQALDYREPLARHHFRPRLRGQTLLTAWLIERWFGRAFKLEDVPQVLGFLVASAVGAAMAAFGAVAAVSLLSNQQHPLWMCGGLWFAACLLGTVTVAPLLIGLGEAVRELPPRRELIEGAAGLATLAALSVFVISLPQGPWATALPVALVFSPPVMDRRTLPAGVRSCCGVCREL